MIKKILLCAALFFIGTSFAQSDEQGQVFSRFDGAEDGVNPLSGSAAFKKSLATITSGKVSTTLELNYSGNVTEVAKNRNDIAPSSWVGLGWSMGHGKIICDDAGTMWLGDDSYYLLSSAGVRYKIIKDNDKWWLESLPYWKVEQKKQSVLFGSKLYDIVTGWVLTDENGTKYTYGDLDYDSISPTRNATEYTIANPYSYGIVGVYQNGRDALFPNAWNLKRMDDYDGNYLSFSYEQYTERVKMRWQEYALVFPVIKKKFTHTAYTKECYLKEISSSQGGKIEIITKPKNYSREVLDKMGEPEISKPYEPDTYIDPIERRFLHQIVVYGRNNTVLMRIDFCYENLDVRIKGVVNEDYTKRLLTGIIETDSMGVEIQKEYYAYYKKDVDKGGNPLPLGAIDSIIGPNCGIVKYDYKSIGISDVDPVTGLHVDSLNLTGVAVGMLENGTPYLVGFNRNKKADVEVYFRKYGKWVFNQTIRQGVSGSFIIGDKNWFIYKTAGDENTYYLYVWNGQEWKLDYEFTDHGSRDVIQIGPGYLLTARIESKKIKLRIPWSVWGRGDYSAEIDDVDDDQASDRNHIHLFAGRNHFGLFFRRSSRSTNDGALRIYSFNHKKEMVNTLSKKRLDGDNVYTLMGDNVVVGLTEGTSMWPGYYAEAYHWCENDKGEGGWVKNTISHLNGRQGESSFQALGQNYFAAKHNDNDDMSLFEYKDGLWTTIHDNKNMVHHQDYDPVNEAEWEGVNGSDFFIAKKPRILHHWNGNKIRPNREFECYYHFDGKWRQSKEQTTIYRNHIYAGSDWYIVKEQKMGYIWNGLEWVSEDYSETQAKKASKFLNENIDSLRAIGGDYFVAKSYNKSALYYKKRDSFRNIINGFFVAAKHVKDPVEDKTVDYTYDYGSLDNDKRPIYDYVTKSPFIYSYTIKLPENRGTIEKKLCDIDGGIAQGEICVENFYYDMASITPTRSTVKTPERFHKPNWPKYIYQDRIKSVKYIDNISTKSETYTYADSVNGLVSMVVYFDEKLKNLISKTINIYAAEKYNKLRSTNRLAEKAATYQIMPDCNNGTSCSSEKIVSGTAVTYSSEFGADSVMRIKETWEYRPRKNRESTFSFKWDAASHGPSWSRTNLVKSYYNGVANTSMDLLNIKSSTLFNQNLIGVPHASIKNAGINEVLILPGDACNFDNWSGCSLTDGKDGRDLGRNEAGVSKTYGRFAKKSILLTKASLLKGTLKAPANKKYRFSAWVQGTSFNEGSDTLQLYLNSSKVKDFALKGNKQWEYLEWESPFALNNQSQTLTLSALNDTEIHLQDIRFVPEDADVNVTYWDYKLNKPIATVNSRGVGSYIEYDFSGRVLETYGEMDDGTIFLKKKNTYLPGSCAILSDNNYALKEISINGQKYAMSSKPDTMEVTVPNNTDEIEVSWKSLVQGKKIFYRLYRSDSIEEFHEDCCIGSEALSRSFDKTATMNLEIAVSSLKKPYKVIINKSTSGWVDYGHPLARGFAPVYLSEKDVSGIRYLTDDGIWGANLNETEWIDYDSLKREGAFLNLVSTANNGNNYLVALPNYTGIYDTTTKYASSRNGYAYQTIQNNWSNYGSLDNDGVKSDKYRITTSPNNVTYVLYERVASSQIPAGDTTSLGFGYSLVVKHLSGNTWVSSGVVANTHADDADIAVGKNNVPFVAYIGNTPNYVHQDTLIIDTSDTDDSEGVFGGVYDVYDRVVVVKHFSSSKNKWIGYSDDDGDVLKQADGSPILNATKLKMASSGSDVFMAVLCMIDSKYALKVYKLTESGSRLNFTELIDGSFNSGIIAYLEEDDHFDIAVDGNTPYVSFENRQNDNKLTVLKYESSRWSSVGRPAFVEVSDREYSADLSLSKGTGSQVTPYVVVRESENSQNRLRQNKIVPMKYSQTGDQDLTLASMAEVANTSLASEFRQYILNYVAFVSMDVDSIPFEFTFKNRSHVESVSIDVNDEPLLSWKNNNMDKINIRIPLNSVENEIKFNINGSGKVPSLTYSFVIKREVVPELSFSVGKLGKEQGFLSPASSSSYSSGYESSSSSYGTTDFYTYTFIPSDDDESIEKVCLEYSSNWYMIVQSLLFSRPICLDFDKNKKTFILSSESSETSSSSSGTSSQYSSSSQNPVSSSVGGNQLVFVDDKGNTKIVTIEILSSSSVIWNPYIISSGDPWNPSTSSSYDPWNPSTSSSYDPWNPSTSSSYDPWNPSTSSSYDPWNPNTSSSYSSSSSGGIYGETIGGTVIPQEYGIFFNHQLVANQTLTFENAVNIQGGSFMARSVSVAANAMINGDVLCSGNVSLSSNAYIKSIVLGGSLSTQAGAQYGSLENAPVDVPSIPIRSFSADGLAFNVWSGQSASMSPGMYGDVNIYAGANITLEPGVYYFKSLYIAPNVNVTSTNVNHPIQIWVQGNVSVGDNASVMSEYNPNLFFIYSNAASNMYFGVQSRISATVVYPNGTVNLAPKLQYKGKVWAKSIIVGANLNVN